MQVQVAEWRASHETRASQPEPKTIQHWVRPNAGWVKINSDVAFSRYGEKGGGGAVLRDHQAAFRAGLCHFFPNTTDPEMVEVLACRQAVRMAIDLNFRRVHVELDCLTLVKKLNDSQKNFSAAGPWVEEIKAMLRSMEESKVTWIRRSGNVAAHKLAKVGEGENRSEIWVGTPPDFILDVISDEIPSYV